MRVSLTSLIVVVYGVGLLSGLAGSGCQENSIDIGDLPLQSGTGIDVSTSGDASDAAAGDTATSDTATGDTATKAKDTGPRAIPPRPNDTGTPGDVAIPNPQDSSTAND